VIPLQRTPGRAVTITVAALLGVLLGAWLGGAGRDAPAGDAGPAASSALPRSVTEPRPAPQATRPAHRSGTAVPTGLAIPRLGIRLPVQPAGVDRQGDMALPATPYRLAWYRFGPRPLDTAGATVLAGHVDTAEDGVGPLARLGELRAGDLLRVQAGRRTVTYRVDSVTRVAKAVLDLPAVFSRTGEPRLHLLTCGGAYLPDQGGYQDNVVVAASRD
jgi:LPXTG-site transpeptidase (sortase) family protein